MKYLIITFIISNLLASVKVLNNGLSKHIELTNEQIGNFYDYVYEIKNPLDEKVIVSPYLKYTLYWKYTDIKKLNGKDLKTFLNQLTENQKAFLVKKNVIDLKINKKYKREDNIEANLKDIAIKLVRQDKIYIPELSKDISLIPYLVDYPKLIEFKPKETKKVTFRYQIPKNYEGTKYVSIGFERKNNKITGTVNLRQVNLGIIAISNKNNRKFKLDLKKIKFKYKNNILESKINIKNNGNTFFKDVKGEIVIFEGNKVINKMKIGNSSSAKPIFQTQESEIVSFKKIKLNKNKQYKYMINLTNKKGEFFVNKKGIITLN